MSGRCSVDEAIEDVDRLAASLEQLEQLVAELAGLGEEASTTRLRGLAYRLYTIYTILQDHVTRLRAKLYTVAETTCGGSKEP